MISRGVDLVQVVLHQVLEPGRVLGAEVEVLEPAQLVLVAEGDGVEVVLEAGRERVVHELVEVLLQRRTTAKAVQVGTRAWPFFQTYPRSRMVWMMLAHVEGRPMPSSSSRFTRLASV